MSLQSSAPMRDIVCAGEAGGGDITTESFVARQYDRLRRSFWDGTFFLPLIAAALWVLVHPYQGILGDASIYIGRALADLDPQGLGRDLLFAHDGQSRFSLYPWLVKQLVVLLGTDRAALTLVLLSTCLWIAGTAALARQFVSWRRAWIVVAFVAVLPASYGILRGFSFSEATAVPRPMAEALVLLALAALARGRTRGAFAVLFIAALVHPLMALAGWAVAGLVLGFKDRRWFIAAAAAALITILAALLGVPLFDRLLLPVSAEVKAAMRSSMLFPTHWPINALGPIVSQTATIAIAATQFQERQRHLLLAAIAVGIAGVAIQVLFGDIFNSLLVVQAQFWRMLWLTAAMGSFALALCAIELWPRDAKERIVLALLTMAWLASEQPGLAVFFSVAALVLHFTKDRFAWPISAATVRIIWVFALFFALIDNLIYFINYARLVAQTPPGAHVSFADFWSERYIAFPICVLILALMLPRKVSRVVWIGRGITALLLIATGAYFWDDRTPFQHLIDAGSHPAELESAIASRPGEVLWVEGLQEAWYLTGRPQWVSAQQQVASIFSRDLAITYRSRMAFLRDEGLADRNILSSLAMPSSAELPHITDAGITHLCTRQDAPAWVIAPIEEDENLPKERQSQIWHLPQPLFKTTDEGNFYAWHKIEGFLILPCAA